MFHLAHRKKKVGKENPLGVYEKVRGEFSSLLYSGKDGRYSFIGYEPFMLLMSKNEINEVSTIEYSSDEIIREAQVLTGDTLKLFQALLDQMKLKKVDKDFPPFVGGAMGFMSYDFGFSLQNLNPLTVDDVEVPDLAYGFYDKVIAFDHEMKDLYFFGLGETKAAAQAVCEEVYQDVIKSSVKDKSSDSASQNGEISVKGDAKKGRAAERLQVFLDKQTYFDTVSNIKRYLHDGDTYQVNFSYRFAFESEEDPFQIYKKLCAVNPAPFSCFFDFPEGTVMSSSPERLVSLRNGVLQTEPIKGTRSRGKNKKEDEQFKKELLASKKDEAELSMIVDLMRNDFGKLCTPGSVKVVAHRDILKCSHVMHTYSVIQGKLKKGKSYEDIIRAVFPGGSVTGCPKKRTMQIINELEGYHRDVYCGSAGYISMSGNMDLNILIRTLLYKDGVVLFHSGGGIVVDSDPESEFQETLDKAEALVESLG